MVQNKGGCNSGLFYMTTNDSKHRPHNNMLARTLLRHSSQVKCLYEGFLQVFNLNNYKTID